MGNEGSVMTRDNRVIYKN